VVLTAVGIVLAALGAAAAAIYLRQEALIFGPVQLPPDYVFDFPDVVETEVVVDGAVLSALHLRLPDPKGVVFYLHGNSGNLANWFVDLSLYRRANFDLFMLDYRGYGKSTGRIRSEAQLRADVAAAWRQLAPLYQGRRTVIFGRSLGTALAAGLAVQTRPDLTILVSPFWSLTELARLHLPVAPAGLLRYRLETHRDLAHVEGPVLLVHGGRDVLIPFSHSVRLQAVARSARLVEIAEAAHNDLQDFAAYRGAIAEHLARL
ncbi:MAG TPA: alpha/beta fold hydrolase, partial [Burkholderiaceae bacterium]|nr:alpha/beta fold hydrolase [Burkholderiaceae bacterium]